MLRRGGTNAVLTATVGRAPTNKIVVLPKDTSPQKARCHTKALGNKALGVVCVRSGFATRGVPSHRPAVEAALYPAQAALGDFISLNASDADEYIITRAANNFEMDTLYELLDNSTLKWRCKPSRKRRGASRCTSTWNVLAPKTTPPTLTTCILRHDYELINVQISKVEVQTKTTMWDDVNAAIINTTDTADLTEAYIGEHDMNVDEGDNNSSTQDDFRN